MKSVLVLFCLAGMAFAAPPPKKKAPVANAPASARGKKTVAPTSRKPVATASSNRKPATASSRAIYSRSNSRRGRVTSNRAAAVKTPSHWQSRPTAERYTEIQTVLAEKGFFKGEPNGTWGADSVSALKEFQRSQNLEPDGKLGSLSLIALGMGPKRIIASADSPAMIAPPPGDGVRQP